MKVQLQGQSLRLRIDEDELARLLDGGVVANETRAPGAALGHFLRIVEGAAATFAVGSDGWHIGLPDEDLRGYVSGLPSRDALEFTLGGGDAALALVFEVDVRDSVRRRGPPPRRRPR
ncbi:hypothetical protein [Luteimonas sp. MC1895]|uniref:hypothetical protein n=1 Tax=Luteimonas sp. MC1895 TaxID=2819513 RepID=UPI0018F0A30E|nr:hypothetical protein [Luteimonas sp. MC1895]MBJ6978272.1 hypothetical protein [Luteimonas sp. MC1895]